MNNLVSLDHINLSVKNFSESAEWYKNVFNFEIVEQSLYKGLPWGVLRSQDTMLCIYEEKDKQAQAERQVTSTFAIAQSKKIQKEYREKAIQELTKSYNQGRTDIAILIDSMNKYFTSEVEYVRSIGNYQIALNEWAATRDELIPNKEEK